MGRNRGKKFTRSIPLGVKTAQLRFISFPLESMFIRRTMFDVGGRNVEVTHFSLAFFIARKKERERGREKELNHARK